MNSRGWAANKMMSCTSNNQTYNYSPNIRTPYSLMLTEVKVPGWQICYLENYQLGFLTEPQSSSSRSSVFPWVGSVLGRFRRGHGHSSSFPFLTFFLSRWKTKNVLAMVLSFVSIDILYFYNHIKKSRSSIDPGLIETFDLPRTVGPLPLWEGHGGDLLRAPHVEVIFPHLLRATAFEVFDEFWGAGTEDDVFIESVFFITHLVNCKILTDPLLWNILISLGMCHQTGHHAAAHHSSSFLLNVCVSGSGTSSTVFTVKALMEHPWLDSSCDWCG